MMNIFEECIADSKVLLHQATQAAGRTMDTGRISCRILELRQEKERLIRQLGRRSFELLSTDNPLSDDSCCKGLCAAIRNCDSRIAELEEQKQQLRQKI